ncbi:DUF779 domain-containing protein, partial [Rhodococcus erythropolis]|nr:DUF779 domain-containing protein [Rhodococcus erythropolis]
LGASSILVGADWEAGVRPSPPTVPQVVAEAVDACPVPGAAARS